MVIVKRKTPRYRLDPDEILTVDQAASEVNLSEIHFRRIIDKGLIQGVSQRAKGCRIDIPRHALMRAFPCLYAEPRV